MRLCFGEFELWPQERRLLRQGCEQALGGRAFDLLLALAEGRGRVVPNAELIERVWPGTAVEPNNLQVQVWALRRLLGPQAIATVARRGYRFTLPVAPGSGVAPQVPGPRRPGLADTPWAGLMRRHGWVTLLLAPGQPPEPLRADAVTQARPLGRTLFSLDARHLPPTRQALDWLDRLGQGRVLLWLDHAPQAGVAALSALRAQLPDSVQVLAPAPAPLGVPGEQVCAAVGLVPTAVVPTPATAAAAGLRWRERAAPGAPREH